ncbi:PTS-dependent dihydroxyacetone kinase, phosphotransferase subunit dhaM [Sporolactobacillus sp. THM7-7]|nr:PTS-dependent dihydroxyacetone kinase, phosphotransferase subunit dhaM [Sporolactobacillus sp. THM7-7]
MVEEVSDKEIIICDTAFVESAYTAAVLLQAKVPLDQIMEQLKPLKVK